MKANKAVSIFLIFLWMTALTTLAVDKETKEKILNSRPRQSLIHKELLRIKRKKPDLPQRNIFAPRFSKIKAPQPGLDTPFNFQSIKEDRSSDNLAISSNPLDLRYIGYIDNGEKIVALIIFEGQAVAVQEGDKLNEKIKVGKITTREIEIIGPGHHRQQYSLQGEKE
ncbi:MAG: hypothetical protein ACE5GI_02175 [Candidatus Aminicenantales bacterium]